MITSFQSEPDPRIGLEVRVTGGKYNGFEGTVMKVCLPGGSDPQVSGLRSQVSAWASILVTFEGKAHELVCDLAHLTPLAVWRASKSATELALKGAS